ncbi:MAG: hypothetical protein ACYTDY_03045 [Planctomycetota bacterium]
MAALSTERVWIIALPVVFAAILDWLARILLIFHMSSSTHQGLHALLLTSGGPMTIRTGVLLVCVATTAYAALWTLVGIREVMRQGKRSIPGPAFGRAVAVGMFLVVSIVVTVSASRLPTADTLLRGARKALDEAAPAEFIAVVQHEVVGARELCRELRDEGDADLRFYGAAGLYHVGDRSAETRHAIHDWIEANRETLSEEWRRFEWALHLVRHPGPSLQGRLHEDWEHGHRGWWDEVRESFRQP